MEKHTCKLCSRRFSNGRALGGHMRSHATTIVPAVKPALPEISFTSSSEGGGTGTYDLRENPRKSFRIADPEFSSHLTVLDAGSSVVQDGESEAESPRAPSSHRRRSKRRRRVLPEAEPVSSVSDATTEEDVALSLMMLSRDIWTVSTEAEQSPPAPEQSDDCSRKLAGSALPEKQRFQCDECKKVFRSYQALGGHRVSHRKQKEGWVPAAGKGIAGEQKLHECPVCFRVFGSGQALGGHKRSHLCSTIAATMTTTMTKTMATPSSSSPVIVAPKPSLIDLNLPAPMEDDVIELSAVSDAEFVMSNYQTDPRQS